MAPAAAGQTPGRRRQVGTQIGNPRHATPIIPTGPKGIAKNLRYKAEQGKVILQGRILRRGQNPRNVATRFAAGIVHEGQAQTEAAVRGWHVDVGNEEEG